VGGTPSPPIQWSLRTLSSVVKRPGREADQSLPQVLRLRMSVAVACFHQYLTSNGAQFLAEHGERNIRKHLNQCVGTKGTGPSGLKRRSAADRLLGSRVRIPPGAWMSVSCESLCCQVEVSATGRSLVQRMLPTVVCV
jgi:hypothetical protein